MDIKDKNGKFIRSVMTSNKDKFYELLNAMEKAKDFANGNYSDASDKSGYDNTFAGEVKAAVNDCDKNNYTKWGILGILMGIFLCIASNSSGIAFLYGGFALIVISIVFIVVVNIKLRRK
jgi:hypothetical protein